MHNDGVYMATQGTLALYALTLFAVAMASAMAMVNIEIVNSLAASAALPASVSSCPILPVMNVENFAARGLAAADQNSNLAEDLELFRRAALEYVAVFAVEPLRLQSSRITQLLMQRQDRRRGGARVESHRGSCSSRSRP